MAITKHLSSEMRLKDICYKGRKTQSIHADVISLSQDEKTNIKSKEINEHYPESYLCDQSSSSTSSSSFNMAVWSSRAGFRADITGFQSSEAEKNYVRKKLRFYASILFLLAVLAAALTIMDTQITASRDDQQIFLDEAIHNFSRYNHTKDAFQKERERVKLFTTIELVLKSLISVLTVLTWFTLYFYYQHIYALKVIKHFYPENMSFIRATPLVKKFIIECAVCALHLPPYLTQAGVSPRFQLIVVLRLYLLARYLKEKHELMNSPSTRFLASVTKTDLTSMFLFKTFFMQYPFQLILLAYIILLFVGGYCVWLLEERYSYLDTVWMLIITMTTVGFGDLTPKTTLGRFTVGLAAIVGIFLMALFISLVNEALMLQRREKRILAYVENTDHIRHRKVTALNAIGAWYKYYSFINKHLYARDRANQSLLDKSVRKADIFKIAKSRILESRMFLAVNQWRKVKETQVSGYFAQEFMVEDMKNMIGHLDTKVNGIEDKLEEILMKGQTDSGTQGCEKKTRRRTTTRDSRRSSKCTSPPTISSPPTSILSNKPPDYAYEIEEETNNYKDYDIVENQQEQQNYKPPHYQDNKTHTAQQFFFQKPVQKLNVDLMNLLHENKNGRHKMVAHNGADLQMAFKLLHNQAQLMNTALDDIYTKTKQDIGDLENIIASLIMCTENESKREDLSCNV